MVIENFDSKKYRENLAEDIKKEPEHKKRQKILSSEKLTERYKRAKDLSLVERGRALEKADIEEAGRIAHGEERSTGIYAKELIKADHAQNKLAKIRDTMSIGRNLTREDLVFLYDIDNGIQRLNGKSDPLIVELQKKRNPEEDMLIVFDCTKDQIARKPEEVKENTKAYIGELFPGIFKKGIEHVFTSFPEGKLLKYNIETTGMTSKDFKIEFDKRKILHEPADDLLDEMEVSGKKKSMNLIKINIKDLGLGRQATIDQVYQKAEKLGLELCPAEVGPNLRLQSDTTGLLEIAMKPIERNGKPCVFELDRFAGKLELHAKIVMAPKAYDHRFDYNDSWWETGSGFIFCLPK